LNNITFYDPVAYIELSDLLCSADLHILFQKNNVIDAVMPSKILAMMASEKPSLITGNLKSEVCSIINKSNAGLYTDSKNLQEIFNFIEDLKVNPALSSQYGKEGRIYVDLNFSKDKVLKKFEKVLLDL
jgi:colanic acid biosynthesis glycosyl transferase WcaI